MTHSVNFAGPSSSLHYGQPFRFDFQVRYSGELVAADSLPTVTFTDSSGTELVTAQNTVNESTGVYYYDYTLPSDGPAGIWLIELNYLYQAVAQETKHNFRVEDRAAFNPTSITTVTADGIRHFCRSIPRTIVTDDMILLYIFESSAYIEQIKADNANVQAVLLSKFFDVCVATFTNYLSQVQENITAVSLEDAYQFLKELRVKRERWMELVTGTARQDVSFTNIVPVISSGSISTIRLSD